MRIEQVLIPAVRQIVARPKIADALFRFDPYGNPFSDEALAEPMILAERTRKHGPVHWHPLYQQWFITGYDEAREVLASPHVGTAKQMDVLLDVRPYTKLNETGRSMLRNLMLVTDPPLHTRQRSLVNRAFTPKQVSRLADMMDSMVDELLATFDDEIELMTDFAVPFPAMVIAELFGFERSDWTWLRDLSRTLSKITDPIRSFDPDEVSRAATTMRERVLELAERRRRDPRDDLMTGLARAEAEDGDRLTEDELVAVSALILFAGHETTSAQIGLSVLMLREHPDQLAQLRDEPELWPNAIEELLRFDPTLRSDPRTVLEDFEVAGQMLKEGQNIIVMPHLANRDFRRFDDADDFRIDREDPAPLSFGHGIHYCLGANLARAELKAALPPLLDKLDDYVVDRDRIEWRPSLSLRGPGRFPMTKRGEPSQIEA